MSFSKLKLKYKLKPLGFYIARENTDTVGYIQQCSPQKIFKALIFA